jgi:phage terminase large subunit-like protein
MTCGLSVPRQNGKNGALEIRELFGMVGLGEKFLHTAHEVKTAQKHFRRLKHFFGEKAGDPGAKFPELNALVKEVRNVNGQEAIYLTNGGSVEIVARSKGSGRGFTVDVIVFDEAQELADEALEALAPTMSAAPLRNPQRIYTGTPPGPKANGEVFTRVRKDALARPGRRCWHEWSCEGDVDLDSPEEWANANPALGGRLQFEVIEGERGEFSDEGFARERLGMWSGAASNAVIDSDTWHDISDENSFAVDRFALAVDVAPDMAMASIALAGQRDDGLWHVELDEQRPGIAWLAPYLVRLMEANPQVRAVVIDGASPAAAIIDDLTKAKIKVTTSTARDMAAACGQVYSGAYESWLRHTNQPQLNVALSVARKRSLGDAWAWNRKSAASDITPLVACTLALWGAQSSTVKKPQKRRNSDRRAVVI